MEASSFPSKRKVRYERHFDRLSTVADYATWRAVYDSVDALRSAHGCTAEQVVCAPGNPNDVFATHDFPSVEQRSGFAADPALAAVMQRGGVASEPRIEIFERV